MRRVRRSCAQLGTAPFNEAKVEPADLAGRREPRRAARRGSGRATSRPTRSPSSGTAAPTLADGFAQPGQRPVRRSTTSAAPASRGQLRATARCSTTTCGPLTSADADRRPRRCTTQIMGHVRAVLGARAARGGSLVDARVLDSPRTASSPPQEVICAGPARRSTRSSGSPRPQLDRHRPRELAGGRDRRRSSAARERHAATPPAACDARTSNDRVDPRCGRRRRACAGGGAGGRVGVLARRRRRGRRPTVTTALEPASLDDAPSTTTQPGRRTARARAPAVSAIRTSPSSATAATTSSTTRSTSTWHADAGRSRADHDHGDRPPQDLSQPRPRPGRADRPIGGRCDGTAAGGGARDGQRAR